MRSLDDIPAPFNKGYINDEIKVHACSVEEQNHTEPKNSSLLNDKAFLFIILLLLFHRL